MLTEQLKNLEKLTKKLVIPENDPNIVKLPHITITNGEQYVPAFLALQLKEAFIPSKELVKNLDTELFKKEWKQFLVNNTKKEYNTILYQRDTDYMSVSSLYEIVMGNRLKEGSYSLFNIKFGFWSRITRNGEETLECKYYNKTYYDKVGINNLQLLTVVKAKCLPLLTTSLILQKPISLDDNDIIIYYDPIALTSTPNQYLNQNKEVRQVSTDYWTMYSYLAGEDNRTQEELLNKTIKSFELEVGEIKEETVVLDWEDRVEF